MNLEENKTYSRKEFLTTIGSITAAAFLLKFFNIQKIVKTITAKSGNTKNAYGNNTYGGVTKA